MLQWHTFKARSTFSAVISRPALLKAVPTTLAGGCPAEEPAALAQRIAGKKSTDNKNNDDNNNNNNNNSNI